MGAYVLVRAAVEVRAAREAVRLCVEALMLTVVGVVAVSASQEVQVVLEVEGCSYVEAAALVVALVLCALLEAQPWSVVALGL